MADPALWQQPWPHVPHGTRPAPAGTPRAPAL